jgi:hypothetical protein
MSAGRRMIATSTVLAISKLSGWNVGPSGNPCLQGGEDVKVYPLTSGQPPSFSGRNASAAGIVARSL